MKKQTIVLFSLALLSNGCHEQEKSWTELLDLGEDCELVTSEGSDRIVSKAREAVQSYLREVGRTSESLSFGPVCRRPSGYDVLVLSEINGPMSSIIWQYKTDSCMKTGSILLLNG